MEEIGYNTPDIIKFSGSILEKYKPKSSPEIVGNKNGIQSIITWLKSFEENKDKFKTSALPKKKKKTTKNKLTDTKLDDSSIGDKDDKEDIDELSGDTIDEEIIENDESLGKKNNKKQGPYTCLLLTGPHGIGKTCSIHTILNEKNYNIQTINFQKLKTTKNVNELLDNIKMKKNDVYNQLHQQNDIKIAVVIDNLESITTLSEKVCIRKLIEINDTQWLFPLFFVTNTQHSKFINEIDKKAHSVRFWNPFPNEIKPFVIKVCKNEKINFSDFRCYDKIIFYSQSDIRKILYLLQDIKKTFDIKAVDYNSLVEYLNMFKKKDIDMTLISATRMLLQDYNGIANTLKQHELEKVTLPLMIHQNYLDSVELLCNNDTTKHELTSEIAEYLSRADVVENYMYGYQIWSIYEVQGIYSCVIPSYLLNEYTENPMNMKLDITYTKDPNRTSIKKINKKNKININKVLKNLDINDCVYISQIIKELLEENKIDDCKKLLNGYNLTLSNIDTLLKIDKTKTSKNTLDTSIKNKLTQIISGENSNGSKKRKQKVVTEKQKLDTSSKKLTMNNKNNKISEMKESIKENKNIKEIKDNKTDKNTKRVGKKLVKYK
jgi:hypothetical protein